MKPRFLRGLKGVILSLGDEGPCQGRVRHHTCNGTQKIQMSRVCAQLCAYGLPAELTPAEASHTGVHPLANTASRIRSPIEEGTLWQR